MSVAPGEGSADAAKQNCIANLQYAPALNRYSAAILPGDVLMEEFRLMMQEEPGVREEALQAAWEMRKTPVDALDQKLVAQFSRKPNEGIVGRRAPANPFHSPLLGRATTRKDRIEKVDDPALQSNPLRGRLIVTIGVNVALFMVFCQALIFNRLDKGSFYASRQENSNVGPSAQTLYDLGGLNATAVRGGQWIRLFWSMWMHSGWLHISLNILCQLQYFVMLEPDWGFARTLLIFWVAGISGNLLSMTMDPCKTTVGSSGGLFGLMGGVVPYCIEYWHSIPRPMCILVFSVITVFLTLATGLTKTTDTWAHLGGLIGGLLFGFGTITTPAAFLPKARVFKRQMRKNGMLRWFQNSVNPDCKCGPREWIIRIGSWCLLGTMWTVCFVHLYSKYEYQPPGSLTFNGITKCCCCYDWTNDSTKPEVRSLWICSHCDELMYEDNPNLTWEMYCQDQGQHRT